MSANRCEFCGGRATRIIRLRHKIFRSRFESTDRCACLSCCKQRRGEYMLMKAGLK